VKDHAVVTGTTNGGTPNGTVSFFICNPSQVTGSGSSTHCDAGAGSAVSGNPVTATAITGSSPPKSEATSGLVTANAVGTWCFRATFTPTAGGNYSGTSSDNTNGECFLVTDSTSATSAQSWVPNDSGTVAATGGTALNGTLSIQLYEGTCASATAVSAGATAVSGQLYQKTLTNATTAADRTLTTSNSTYIVTGNKSVAWLVSFAPAAGSNVSGSTHCETSTLTVNNN
jgi:hypothetical protein